MPRLAIVIPCFNEALILPFTLEKLISTLDFLIENSCVAKDSYLFFVDDGSKDETWSIIEASATTSPSIKGCKLSRNFGHQNALYAGLMLVSETCDISISIDADLQQDPLAMLRFVEEYKKGAEIVFGVRNDRKKDSFFKKVTGLAFYRVMRMLGVDIIPNHADYRLLSKCALQALSMHKEPNVFLRAICAQLGFKTSIVNFDVNNRRAGESKYSFSKMFKLAIDGVTSFSVVPLRLIALTGAIVFGLSAVMGCYVLYQSLVKEVSVQGWASITLPIYCIGGLQIFFMGVIGEYIAQILIGVKDRPRYIIEKSIG